MKASRLARRGDEGIQLNLVPMINMVFLLLIYFLFTMALETQEGVLETQTPSGQGEIAESAEDPEEREARVRIVRSADGVGIFFRGWPVSGLRDLASQLRPLPAETPILIDAAPDVSYQDVIRVQNVSIRSGHKNVVFTIPSG